MAFHSIVFVFVFLPLLILFYYVCPKKIKNSVILLASMVFYAWGEPRYILLLIGLILLNYGLARYLDKQEARRKLVIKEAIILNLVVLIYFKYYGFMLDSLFSILPIRVQYEVLPMPLGISFFTFSIIAYLFDVYRKKIPAEKHLGTFALYVSFFPKLIMGPIERYDKMQKQMKHHPVNALLMEKGFQTFLLGLLQKVVIADSIAYIWQYASSNSVSIAYAWLGMIAYTLQIYFDFNGYTKMAIGLGNMFGFELSENFKYPYIATTVTDFWRRWHITLSSWFRDYVYIPLGGNRTSFAKHLRNLLIVWVLTGIWHGASWNFLFWGLYYGVVLIIEKYVLVDQLCKLPLLARRILTLFVIMFGWIFFASNDLSSAFAYIGSMFGLQHNGFIDQAFLQTIQSSWVYLVIGIVWCTPFFKVLGEKIQPIVKKDMWFIKPLLTICAWLLVIMFMVSSTYQSFLYFQF